MSEEMLAFARARNVSKIVVGKPRARLWQRIVFGSIVDALVQGSGDIDVDVISGERERRGGAAGAGAPTRAAERLAAYGRAVVAVAARNRRGVAAGTGLELAEHRDGVPARHGDRRDALGRGPSFFAAVLECRRRSISSSCRRLHVRGRRRAVPDDVRW